MMKKRIIGCGAVLLALMLSGMPLSAQGNRAPLTITLDDALEIALSENLTIQVADQEIQKRKYAKKGTYAGLYPQVDFSTSYQRTLEKQVMYMDVPLPGMDDGIKVGMDNNWSTGFTATMPIISATLWKDLKISAYDVEIAIEQARGSRIDMIDQVKRAFYSVLLAEESYEVFRKAYDNAVYNHNETKQKYEQGIVAEYDVIRANVNVKNAEPSMYDAENAIMLAKWQLKALMGIDLDLEIDLAGKLTDYEDYLAEISYVNPDIPLEENSTLKQLQLQQEQQHKRKKAELAKFYPSLNVVFSYQWMSMSNNAMFKNFKWDPYSTLGLSLSIPIFSGGKRYTGVKQAEVTLRQIEMQKYDTERNLRVALRQSSDQMNTSIKQYNAAKAGVEESEKSYSITMKRYETGEGTILEINDSQLSMTQARLNLNQSIYNYMVAKSALEKTLGLYE